MHRDGRTVIGGGRSRFLYAWSVESHGLQRIIELPSKIKAVKQLEFLPDSFDGGANQVPCNSSNVTLFKLAYRQYFILKIYMELRHVS